MPRDLLCASQFPSESEGSIWTGGFFPQMCPRFFNNHHGERKVFSQKQKFKINTFTEIGIIQV